MKKMNNLYQCTVSGLDDESKEADETQLLSYALYVRKD
jgi:hypothetical protein